MRLGPGVTPRLVGRACRRFFLVALWRDAFGSFMAVVWRWRPEDFAWIAVGEEVAVSERSVALETLENGILMPPCAIARLVCRGACTRAAASRVV